MMELGVSIWVSVQLFVCLIMVITIGYYIKVRGRIDIVAVGLVLIFCYYIYLLHVMNKLILG